MEVVCASLCSELRGPPVRADNNPGCPDSYEPNGADACVQDALAIESLAEVATPRLTMVIPAPRLPLASEA
ncbi:hypothetical protein B0G74_9125 [Paraburkholderia sp. BL9I2N2]|nr:hypothetical protein B0G74_9125 [Paraburkholderia sp. BL9I2N2]